jgi:hypothetical protein
MLFRYTTSRLLASVISIAPSSRAWVDCLLIVAEARLHSKLLSERVATNLDRISGTLERFGVFFSFLLVDSPSRLSPSSSVASSRVPLSRSCLFCLSSRLASFSFISSTDILTPGLSFLPSAMMS